MKNLRFILNSRFLEHYSINNFFFKNHVPRLKIIKIRL